MRYPKPLLLCCLLLVIEVFTLSAQKKPVVVPKQELWGMTAKGGTDNLGTLFKINSDGTGFETVYAFRPSKGVHPVGGLLRAANKKLYGMTNSGGGGEDDFGVIFCYDPGTKAYGIIGDFDGANGKQPSDLNGLMQASNGKIYGTTPAGGTSDEGVLFSLDPTTGSYNVLYNFGGVNGSKPLCTLCQASNGKLYGFTSAGGSKNEGVLFSFDPLVNMYSKIMDFHDTLGSNPVGSLTAAKNGKMYGMAPAGGTRNSGVFFCLTVTDTAIKKLIDFGQYAKQAGDGLMESTDGKFYGLTRNGGGNSNGSIFSYELVKNTYTQLVNAMSNDKGVHPLGKLVMLNNGKLYGAAMEGGGQFDGTLFVFDPANNTYTTIFNFDNHSSGGHPSGGLCK